MLIIWFKLSWFSSFAWFCFFWGGGGVARFFFCWGGSLLPKNNLQEVLLRSCRVHRDTECLTVPLDLCKVTIYGYKYQSVYLDFPVGHDNNKLYMRIYFSGFNSSANLNWQWEEFSSVYCPARPRPINVYSPCIITHITSLTYGVIVFQLSYQQVYKDRSKGVDSHRVCVIHLVQ